MALTKVLSASVGGNARTAIVATLSLANAALSESRMTLQFASRAAKVCVVRPHLATTGGTRVTVTRRCEATKRRGHDHRSGAGAPRDGGTSLVVVTRRSSL